jgi:MFS family permease
MSTTLGASIAAPAAKAPSNSELRRLVVASALGSVIEWYDFMVFISLAVYISPLFFPSENEAVRVLLSIATLTTGYVLRPVGGVFFGVIGDKFGRKLTFVWTLLIMGVATAAIGVLPTYAEAGIAASLMLVACRALQGLALGGEYAGAAVYVAEHAPADKRGYYTGWIQTSTNVGLLLAISVIFGLQLMLGKEEFGKWGWRVPFLLSAVILIISLYVRTRLEESPAFIQMKQSGRKEHRPLKETLAWKNVKLMLVALFGVVAGQAALGNMGLVFSLLFMQAILKVDPQTTNGIFAVALILIAPCFVFFGWLSDRIGRKKLMILGMLLAAVCYLPVYMLMKRYSMPANTTVLTALVFLQMFFISIVHGPLAAYLVELFPTSVRTTSLALPFNIGTGIIGGCLPLAAFSLINMTGNIYAGLAYPITVATIAAIVNIVFVRDNHGVILK